tara:strand:- start:54 stop:425 length:372 start_codon:yes stop_codon:yes gene_type:complete
MALQISYTDKSGATHAEAYVKIEVVKWTTTKSICEFEVGVYHNAAARSKNNEADKKVLVDHYRYHISGDTHTTYLAESVLKEADKSLMSQLYAWLKTHVDTENDPTGNPNMGHDINWTTATDV